MLTSLLALALLYPVENTATVPVPRDAGGWDWMARHEAVKNVPFRKDSRMVFIGDSITHAFSGEPRTGEGFLDRGREDWDRHFEQYRPINMGFSGDRTQHVLWRIDDGELDGMSPEVVVVMIGTNNLGANTANEIASGIVAVCHRIHRKVPDAHIVLHAIFPRATADSEVTRKLNAVNGAISALDERDYVSYLDIASVFVDRNGNARQDLMPDLLHPNAAGYKAWAEALAPTVEILMAGRWSQ